MTDTALEPQRIGTPSEPRVSGTALTDALHAEWTKLRTVRGWRMAAVLAVAFCLSVAVFAPEWPTRWNSFGISAFANFVVLSWTCVRRPERPPLT